MSIFDETIQELQEDVLRLKAVRLEVPDDEACAAAVIEYGSDWRPKASVVLELEPLSYRLAFKTDPADVNRNEVIRVPVTFSSAKNGLTMPELKAIRESGWLGIPKGKLVKLSPNIRKQNPEKLWLKYQRWSHYALNAGLNIDRDETSGQLSSTTLEQVFVFKIGNDEFPRGDDETYIAWMTYPVRRAPEDFVALPIEQRDTKYLPDPEDNASAAVAATAVGGGGVTAEALTEAFGAAGIIGMNVSQLATPEQQQTVISRALRQAPLLAVPEITRQADNAELISYGIEKGAIAVDDDGTIISG